MKFLILSCGTGEGHNSAAKAVIENLTDKGHSCVFIDPITLKSQKASNIVAGAYNGLIRKAPRAFGFVYKLGALYEATRLPSPVYWANAKYADELYSLIKEEGFDAVISTHLYSMLAITAARKKYSLNIPVFGVLTDYTVIPFFRDAKLDLYFVPTETATEELGVRGVPKEKVYVTGIPVSKNFSHPMEKSEARRLLGIPSDKKIAVILSGGAGCGKQLKLTKSLLKSTDGNTLLYVFSGKNEKLKEKLSKLENVSERVKTVPFTPDVHLYVASADVVLSKPGGLSSTEIATANVPLVHLHEIPGCESANIRYFTSHGLSLPGRSVKKATAAAKRLLEDADAVSQMKENQKRVLPADPSEDISRIIFDYMEKRRKEREIEGNNSLDNTDI